MKLDRTRHLLAITIVCIAYLLSTCDSKQNAHYNREWSISIKASHT
ncbi:MAG: hypothetical protein VCF25_03915 [Candidatus Poribacteria bacterium]